MIELGWAISIVATCLSLFMLWLYGDGDRRAPLLGLGVSLCWIVYDVLFGLWPLLLPTALNAAVQFRNLCRVRE